MTKEIIASYRERLLTCKVPAEVEFRATLPKIMIGKAVGRQWKR